MTGQTNAVKSDEEEFADELKPGTELMHGQYTIEGFLAAGGFGITYLARDSLKRPVVIKECFPGSFCRRMEGQVSPRSRAHQNELASIVKLFSQEASSLAKANHPNIVGVHQIFEENNTAYMALDFVRGRDLLEILQEEPDSLTPDLMESYLVKILDAIKHIHKLGMLHRDISPDNIIINEQGEPILIDFGAARESTNERVTRMLSALRVVKDGYSPQEFYIAGSEQSPSCDLYSLGASFYHLITRELPPDSQWRLSARAAGDKDPYVPLAEKTDAYPEYFSDALDKAMSVLPKDRVQDAEEWLSYLNQSAKVSAAPSAVAAKPQAASTATAEKKNSAMPMLMGTSAIAIAAGAAFFFLSNSDTDVAPSEATVGDSIEAAETTTTPVPGVQEPVTTPTEEVASDTTPAANETEIASVDTGAIGGAETQDSASTVADQTSDDIPSAILPPVEIGAIGGEQVVPPAEQAETAEVSVTRSFAPEASIAPQPRPTNNLEVESTVLADELPTIDTSSPDLATAAPAEDDAPVVAVETPVEPTATEETPVEVATDEPAVVEEETPQVAASEDSAPVANDAVEETAAESGSMLDFFIAMQGDEAGDAANDTAPAQPTVTAPVETRAPQVVEPTVTAQDNVARDAGGNPVFVSRVAPSLPFTLSSSQPGIISGVTPNGPAWLSEGQRILSIEGQPVTSNEDITAAIETLSATSNSSNVEFSVGLDGGANGAAFDGTLSAQMENQVLLLNGLSFAVRQSGGNWATEVIGVPDGSSFRVGDTLVSYISTFEEVTEQNSLQTILERELEDGVSVFNFAVNRDGKVSIEAFTLAALGRGE